MWDESLRRAFALVQHNQDPHARGAQFEGALHALFAKAQYRVVRNAKAATPRQTDLFALDGTERFLIEAKWQRKRAGIDEIDAVRLRLTVMPPGAIGLLFSVSGFAKASVDHLAARREQCVLLFGREDIEALFHGRVPLRALIGHKWEAFVSQGRVVVDDLPMSWTGFAPPDRALLPSPDCCFGVPSENEARWVAGPGGFGPLVFAQDLPDVNWTTALGSGVSFDVVPRIRDRRDVAHVIEVLRQVGWVTPMGRFTCQQNDYGWHGAGARAFLEALDEWETRYARIDPDRRWHHSEDVTYFDLCAGGFYTLSLRVMPDHQGRADYVQLSAQLPGVPAAPDTFRMVAIALGQEDTAYFRPLRSEESNREVRLKGETIRLEAVGTLRSEETGWIAGVVAKNPFQGAVRRASRNARRDEGLEVLEERGLLVCRLVSWHEERDRPDYSGVRYGSCHQPQGSGRTLDGSAGQRPMRIGG